MPRVVAPQPQPAPEPTLYDEAVRFGNQIAGLQHTATRLQQEVDQWERRAKLAEEEVRRLEMRLEMMERSHREREQMLEEQRDKWKMQYNDVEKSLQLAGGIILDIIKKSEGRRAGNVNLGALAAEIDEAHPMDRAGAGEDRPFARGGGGTAGTTTGGRGGGHPEKSCAHLTSRGAGSGHLPIETREDYPPKTPGFDELVSKLTAAEKGPDRP